MIAGIVLAAGRSTRMGTLKAMLPWRGTTLLEYQIRELAVVCDNTIVVLGHGADVLAPIAQAAGGRVVVNPDFERGRSTSIVAGATAIAPSIRAIVVIGVDQPRPAAIYRQVVEAVTIGGAAIARAIHAREHGHPTAFAGSFLGELRAVDEETEGMKSLLRRHTAEIVDVDCDDPIVLVNLNSMDDYVRARARFDPGSHTTPTLG